MGSGLRADCDRIDRRDHRNRTQDQDDVGQYQRVAQVVAAQGLEVRRRRIDWKEFAMRFLNSLRRLVREEQGTESLEWGLICGLIVVGGIVAITAIGPKVKTMWDAT